MNLFLLIIALFCHPFCDSADDHIALPDAVVCLSENEKSLADLVNTYRTENGLKPVTLSSSLTEVAQLHVRNLVEESPFDESGKCNMHSWSKSQKWKGCCYNSGADGTCMWDKPREITSYQGDGYEIIMARFNSEFPDGEVSALYALEAWQESPRHNAVLLNKEIWKSIEFKAMGVGIYKGFAAVWFGQETDPAGLPQFCSH